MTRSSLRAARQRRRHILMGVSATVITLLIVIGMTYWVLIEWSDYAADPWNGVPHCTHEIANAGGICHGEPR